MNRAVDGHTSCDSLAPARDVQLSVAWHSYRSAAQETRFIQDKYKILSTSPHMQKFFTGVCLGVDVSLPYLFLCAIKRKCIESVRRVLTLG